MKERELIATLRDSGSVVAGHCSVCHRPFESPIHITLEASSDVVHQFENHVCTEDMNQAAARIVREATES